MTGEALLHQFFEEVRTWLAAGEVHYRVCPHRGQPHYRPDEPCVWMSREATLAFLAWGVQRGHVIPSWAQACLKPEGLQEGSALADAAAAGGVGRRDHSGGLVGFIRRYPLPALLVGFGVALLLGQRWNRRP